MVRRRWSEVLDTLSRIRRASWVLVNQSATPGEVRDGVMKLIFETEGLKSAFTNGHHDENVIAALRETLGVTVRIKAETGTAAAAESHRGGSAEPEPDPEPSPPPPDDDPYDGVSADDETIENTTLMGVPVIERILEGTVVEESDE